jgi:hypothetical protein
MQRLKIIDDLWRITRRIALFVIAVVMHSVYSALGRNGFGILSRRPAWKTFDAVGIASCNDRARYSCGCSRGGFFRDRRAVWAWVPTGLWLLLALSGWHNSRQWLIDNFFTNRCGETECVYELTFTVPFMVSLAYSLSSLITLWIVRSSSRSQAPVAQKAS